MRILVIFCVVIAAGLAEPQNTGRRFGQSTGRRVAAAPRSSSKNTKGQNVNKQPVLSPNVLIPGAFKPLGQLGSFQLGTLGTLALHQEGADPTLSITDQLISLLPDFRDTLDGLSLKNGELTAQPTKMMEAFFPMIRQLMEVIAASTNRSLTTEEESNLDLTETVMTMSIGVMDDLMSAAYTTDVKKSIYSLLNITRPIVEAYAKREERPVTQEETVFLYYFENSFKFTVEIIDEFSKVSTPEQFVKASSEVAKFFLSSRANAEGRKLSTSETNLIKDIEGEVLTNINIMRGFANYTNTDGLIKTFVDLVEYIMLHNAKRELPKRPALSFKERQLLKTIESALTEGASLLNDLHDGFISLNTISKFNKETRRLWEDEAKMNNATLSATELEYLDFNDQILKTVKLMYKAW